MSDRPPVQSGSAPGAAPADGAGQGMRWPRLLLAFLPFLFSLVVTLWLTRSRPKPLR